MLPLISRQAREAAAAASAQIVEFDSEMFALPAPMPAILGVNSHENALLIAANVIAMQAALAHPDVSSPEDVLTLHRVLLEHSQPDIAGSFRTQQVWVGGNALSAHGSTFVPPHHSMLPRFMGDLIAFIGRRDIPPLIHSALAHAQFETLHPFVDGNGRVGRALIHSMLTRGIPLRSSTIPVSAGLLTDQQGYFAALTSYRDADPSAIVSAVSHGALGAIDNGRILARELGDIRQGWMERISARSDSIAWRLVELLFTQPVVNAEFIAAQLEVSDRGARDALDLLEHAGVLRRTQTRQERQRNVIWQADELLTAMDAFAARADRRATGI